MQLPGAISFRCSAGMQIRSRDWVEMNDKLLALPWQIQLALGSGYAAYLISYAGIRQHHTTSDAVFRSLVFGLAGSAILVWSPQTWWKMVLAGLAPLAVGALWRWQLRNLVRTMLRLTDVSWSDDLPSAWLSITAERTDLRPSQIAVDTDDGQTLVCDDTRRFAKAPYGPCVFGLDGSIALYVTGERRPDGTWFDHQNVRDPIDGDRLTFLPSSSIKRVEIRYWSQATSTVEEAAAPVPGVVADSAEPSAG